MPALSFEIDGKPLGTLACDGTEVIGLHLNGTRVEEVFSTLHLGATSSEPYLVYLPDVELGEGQTLLMRFLAEGSTDLVGRTIDELFPDEPDDLGPDPDWKALAAESVREARNLPRLRPGYRVWMRAGRNAPFELLSAPDDHGFALDAHWDRWRPDRLALRFSTWTLEHDDPAQSHRTHVDTTLALGDAVEIRIVPCGPAQP